MVSMCAARGLNVRASRASSAAAVVRPHPLRELRHRDGGAEPLLQHEELLALLDVAIVHQHRHQYLNLSHVLLLSPSANAPCSQARLLHNALRRWVCAPGKRLVNRTSSWLVNTVPMFWPSSMLICRSSSVLATKP